jgi:hypothetical protein
MTNDDQVIDDSDFYFTVMFIHYKDKSKFNVDYELSYSLKKWLDKLNHNDNFIKYKEYDDCSVKMSECIQTIRDYLFESVCCLQILVTDIISDARQVKFLLILTNLNLGIMARIRETRRTALFLKFPKKM